jgi:hypothetical protein
MAADNSLQQRKKHTTSTTTATSVSTATATAHATTATATVTTATSSSGCEGHFECVGICVVELGVCWCKLYMRAAFAKVEPRATKAFKVLQHFFAREAELFALAYREGRLAAWKSATHMAKTFEFSHSVV